MNPVFGLVTAASIALAGISTQLAKSPVPFRSVKGVGYDGVVIPPTSPKDLLKSGLSQMYRRGYNDVEVKAWVLEDADVALAERYVAAFPKSASQAPSQKYFVPSELMSDTSGGWPWFVENLALLKRHYYGVMVDNTRHVVIHAFRTNGVQWRSEELFIMHGSCGNVWFDVDLKEGVQRFTCGPLGG